MGVRVKAVRRAGSAPVYNMEVADVHDFVIQGGVVAHNCFDEMKYHLMEYPVPPRRPEKPKHKAYNPLADDNEPIATGYGFIRM